MRLRIVPRTPYASREMPEREVPDEYRIQSHRTNWGELHFTVEGRRRGRVLGDKPFADYDTARAHADMHAKWDGAFVTDHSERIEPAKWGHGNPDHPHTSERSEPETPAAPVGGTSPLNQCEKCGATFDDKRLHVLRSMARKRYCSERCRKAAESARGYERKKGALDQDREVGR